MPKPRIQDIGGTGEQFAAEYLTKAGYRIIEINYVCRSGEIDIVAQEGDMLCFVEVKLRQGQDHGHPLEAITPRKQRKISLAALSYLQEQDLCDCQDVRFDVVAISLVNDICDVQLVRGAFDSSL